MLYFSYFDSLLQNLPCMTNYLLLTTLLVFRVILIETIHIYVTKNNKFSYFNL